MKNFHKQGIKPPPMQMIKATPNTRLKHQQLRFPLRATCLPMTNKMYAKTCGPERVSVTKNNKISLFVMRKKQFKRMIYRTKFPV